MQRYYVFQDDRGFWRCNRDASGVFGPGASLAIGTVYQDKAHAEDAATADANGAVVRFDYYDPATVPPRHVTLRRMVGWDK